MSESSTTKRKRGRPSLKQELDINAILEVAAEVFAEKGFDGAQQKAIAERIGVSNPLISYHFKSKDDLWKKAVTHLGDNLIDKFEEVRGFFKDLKGIALMKAYNRQFIYFFAENPALYHIIYHEMSTDSWRSKWLNEKVLKPIVWFGKDAVAFNEDQIISPLEQKFSRIPIANMSSIMIGSAATFFMLSYQMRTNYNVDPFSKEQIEKHADIVNSLIFGQFES